MFKLIIGNRNYSSWSLRAWLYMKISGMPFEVIRIPLFTRGWRDKIAMHSPAGKVPILVHNSLNIWDTTAIFEYLQEVYPDGLGWPAERESRALARCISAEVHSGFPDVREDLSQNLRLRRSLDPNDLSDPCRAQIKRIEAIWKDCREKYASRGPWLFGEISIADIMFAPIALRFITYGIKLDPKASEFIRAVEDNEAVHEWIRDAYGETEHLDFIDNLHGEDTLPII